MSKTNFQDGQVFDFYKPHKSVGISDWSVSLTRTEFAEECDINVIMQRYETTGHLPLANKEPVYLDLTTVPQDLLSAMDVLSNAENAFAQLPATVRREFDNDPVKFVDFASNPENLSQMQTWGLAPPPEPVVAPAGSPAPSAATPPTEAPKPA